MSRDNSSEMKVESNGKNWEAQYPIRPKIFCNYSIDSNEICLRGALRLHDKATVVAKFRVFVYTVRQNKLRNTLPLKSRFRERKYHMSWYRDSSQSLDKRIFGSERYNFDGQLLPTSKHDEKLHYIAVVVGNNCNDWEILNLKKWEYRCL